MLSSAPGARGEACRARLPGGFLAVWLHVAAIRLKSPRAPRLAGSRPSVLRSAPAPVKVAEDESGLADAAAACRRQHLAARGPGRAPSAGPAPPARRYTPFVIREARHWEPLDERARALHPLPARLPACARARPASASCARTAAARLVTTAWGRSTGFAVDPDREEAARPLPARLDRPLLRDGRLQPGLPLLPELGHLQGAAGRPAPPRTAGRPIAGGGAGAARRARPGSPSPTTTRSSGPSTPSTWPRRPTRPGSTPSSSPPATSPPRRGPRSSRTWTRPTWT